MDNFPGVTRDRIYRDAEWDGRKFTIVDTGGFISEDTDTFATTIRRQVEYAVQDADFIVLVLDGKSGISPFDRDLIEILRKTEKKVFYAVNKIDSPEQENQLFEFYALGMDLLYPVSGEHGFGVRSLLDDLTESLPDMSGVVEPTEIKIAVVGRPNAGKSSLINKILGEERMIVTDIPGTTRDAIDTKVCVNGKNYLFVDTAGIRRKSKVSKKIEKFSVIKALKSLDRCDTALIVIDSTEEVTEQDIKVAGHAFERKCSCIFLLNKWDLVEKDSRVLKRYMERLRYQAKFLNFAPVLSISALTGQRVHKIFNTVDDVYKQYTSRLGTGELNRIIGNATAQLEPPYHKGRRIKFLYATQPSSKPPTFVLFVNHPEAIHFSYERYLKNCIREAAGLDQTPVRIFFRKRQSRPGKK